MTGHGLSSVLSPAIDFQFPMGDIAAVVPYALPLAFVGILILLYQRFMKQTELNRNVLFVTSVLCLLSSFLLVFYAGFGPTLWGPMGPTFGSWWTFVGGLQAITDAVFGSVATAVLFLLAVTVVSGYVAFRVIVPPNPDFVALREQLKSAQDASGRVKSDIERLEREKKELTEFVAEKEQRLQVLQTELDGLKELVSEGEKARKALEVQLKEAASSAGAASDAEQELLDTIAKKDQAIGALQAQIEELRKSMKTPAIAAVATGGEATKTDTKTRELEAQLMEIRRRAETAADFAQSVITDLPELVSEVQASALDPSAKIALSTLLENIVKAIDRVSRPPGDKTQEGPRVEMIGAVMMAHEIADGIKKMARR
ncbi:MAG: hypothetical protein HXY34_08870 [Candidatus Thorarchaeota archaeon]|nr:hypothetical protein [Candidatus Thorarchaeota archaeon]